ncbi:MAG: C1 family peptidase [Bacteroidota bacterium]|nr:C1 family peptidase [Bacteroidota bacterium]MDP4230092.1 C1 family peptidase [Bacteroidota bacterium]MDP4236165.1 C1 family peptidase [Bacteroidota bacterium]
MAKKTAASQPKIRRISRYGWAPDLPDHRDLMYAAPMAIIRKLPPKVDLRSKCPPVYDQGQIGSCTAHAIAGAIHFDEKKEKLSKIIMPSRLFIYYNERVIEGSTSSDSGAQIRDGIKTVTKQGYCSESDWPYNVTKVTIKPPKPAYTDAASHRVTQYQRLVQNLQQLKGCLASGYPFAFGFTVYESFESPAVAKTGIGTMPKGNESVVGGHAVLAVGYDDAKQVFIIRNSWGPKWGMKGYFTLPYTYLMERNLSSDCWTIRTV